MKKALAFILLLAWLSACETPAWGGMVPTAAPITGLSTATVTELPTPASIVIPTPVPDPTGTADTRLPPEDWKQWPVVPSVTAHALQIYQAGLGMGLDPHAFSKVGDCQSVKAAFMGYFDDPTRYNLGTSYASLQQTIDNFAGHFDTDGQAVRGGFNAASELSPLWADPQACLPGENPLECELRITKPVIVIVRMEIWWDGRTTAGYEKLMRQILDTIIAHGAVPILATKADNVEGDNSLNLTTAKLAYEYDLPLWNFWAAVQPMPNHGLETQPPHNDGFHISAAAWSVQSFTALQALDSIWKGLLAASPAGSASAPTLSVTPTPAALATLAQTPAQPAGTAVPGLSGQLVFGLARRVGEIFQPVGVYTFDPAARRTVQLFGSGVQYQAGSPDGKFLLVSQGARLYRTNADGTSPIQLTEALYPLGSRSAVWLPDGRVAAVLTQGDGTTLALLAADGSATQTLSTSAAPIALDPTTSERALYWESGSCSSAGVCQSTGPWVSDPGGNPDQALTSLLAPRLSPDGQTLAAGVASKVDQSNLVFAGPDGANPRPFHFPADQLLDYAWSPTGDVLAAVAANVSGYTGQVSSNRNFLVDPRTQTLLEFPQSRLLRPQVLWSPDGQHLAWIGTLASGSAFTLAGSLGDPATRQVSDLGIGLPQPSPDYLVVSNADWLPQP